MFIIFVSFCSFDSFIGMFFTYCLLFFNSVRCVASDGVLVMDWKGSGHGLSHRSVPEFASRDWGKPLKFLDNVAGVQAENCSVVNEAGVRTSKPILLLRHFVHPRFRVDIDPHTEEKTEDGK